jgi:hypothetical protein
MPNKPNARRFQLHRDEDESGVSGIGIVAEGIQFTNGMVALSWLSPYSAVNVYPAGTKIVEDLHGHQGKTRIVWID